MSTCSTCGKKVKGRPSASGLCRSCRRELPEDTGKTKGVPEAVPCRTDHSYTARLDYDCRRDDKESQYRRSVATSATQSINRFR